MKFGYTRCVAKHCVFYRRHQGKIVIIVVAVDDLSLTSSSRQLLLESKTDLKSEFSITELGEVHWLLGVEVKQNCMTRSITLSQKAYIDMVASRFHLENAKPMHTPMETGVQLSQVTRVEDDEWPFPYREMIGVLMYMVMATRPDIAFTMLTLAQYMQNPTHGRQ